MTVNVAGLVLAAGAGRRYGRPKALVEYDGQLLVERGRAVLAEAGCAPIVVVLGAMADRVGARADLAGVEVVVNEDWATGMGSSLRTGLAALADTAAESVVVLLVDTPGVTPEAVRRVLEHSDPTTLAAATYHGRRGHPVVLGRTHWAGVAALAEGDVGARPYLADHAAELVLVPCDGVADDADLDHPDDRRGSGLVADGKEDA